MTLAKQTLPCEPSTGLQIHGCRDSTLHAGSWLQLHSSLRCFPQMSSPSSITLPSQVPSVWETLLSFLHPASSPWLAPSKTEGLCADVPGERPAPLPWENMWSGSVYAGTLSSCLPHSMLASGSPRWQCSTLLPQVGLSQVEVTPAIMLTHLGGSGVKKHALLT